MAQALAAVTQAEANQRKTQLDVDKYTPLVQDGSVSRQEYDTAVQNNLANKAAVTSARANVRPPLAPTCSHASERQAGAANITPAQANVAAAKAALDNAQLNLGWTQVTSPSTASPGCATLTSGTR